MKIKERADIKPNSLSQTKIFLFCMAVSFVFISICSKNSFLYPVQDWVDSNCFFTVGKSIMNGKVLYSDIIEQKGPVLYFIYSMVYSVSHGSFIGAYIIEFISFSLFLFFSVKSILLLDAQKKYLALIIPMLAFVITVSPAFSHGGSAEELCLFPLAYSVYLSIKIIKSQKIKYIDIFVSGIFFAFVFWIKYTVAATYAGFILLFLVHCIRRKKTLLFLRHILVFLIAFFVVSSFVLAYFWYHNAIDSLIECYFYNNIFNYSNNSGIFIKLFGFIKNTVFTLGRNFIYGIFVVFGFYGIKKHSPELFKSFLILFAFTAIGTYTGGKMYVYYGLVFSLYAVFGVFYALYYIIPFLAKRIGLLTKKKILIKYCLLLLLPVFSYIFSGNTYLMKYDKEDLPQYIFANKISQIENPTLLNYGFLDGGFYLAADILPTTKYFCHLNLKSTEMEDSMNEYIDGGVTDFVVTRDIRLENKFTDLKYELIDESTFVFERKKFTYFLYKRK